MIDIMNGPAMYIEAGEKSFVLLKEDDDELGRGEDLLTLYTDYDFDAGTLTFSIYENGSSDVPRRVARNLDDARDILHDLMGQYPGKIDKGDILERWDVFFQASPAIVSLDYSLSEGSFYCDTCGDYNRDSFGFMFVPAVPNTPMDKASLYFNWSYGCYGGEQYSGEFADGADQILASLNRMLGMANKPARKMIRLAIRTIEQN